MKLSRTAKRKAPSRQRPCGCKIGKKKGWGGAKGKEAGNRRRREGKSGKKGVERKSRGKGGQKRRRREREGEKEKRKEGDRESKSRALVCSQFCIALKRLYSFGYTDVHALPIRLVPGT